MEVFAERATVSYSLQLGEADAQQHYHREALCHPRVLQRANASVLHAALETGIPELSGEAVKAHVQVGKVCIIHAAALVDLCASVDLRGASSIESHLTSACTCFTGS
eukprot:6863411-Lingulodinium_polyedra.AAC.1